MAEDHSFNDSITSINQLKKLVNAFIDERKWDRFHTPKNIAVSVVLEAAELLEHFQWSPPAPEEIDGEKKREISEELADVMAYLLSLANVLEIDVSSAMAAKMQKNRKKYPVEKFNGNWEKSEV
ncbi:MAG: nucleotide pyrophosphohydrolase [Candidatus Rifleibacteriota bacterium]